MQSLLAIADPTRRRIVELLAQRDRTAGELVAEFDLSAPAISQHLNVLARAGLIERTADAQWRRISLRTEPLDEAAAWVDRHRVDWEQRFDLLEERLRDLKGATDV